LVRVPKMENLERLPEVLVILPITSGNTQKIQLPSILGTITKKYLNCFQMEQLILIMWFIGVLYLNTDPAALM